MKVACSVSENCHKNDQKLCTCQKPEDIESHIGSPLKSAKVYHVRRIVYIKLTFEKEQLSTFSLTGISSNLHLQCKYLLVSFLIGLKSLEVISLKRQSHEILMVILEYVRFNRYFLLGRLWFLHFFNW
jgi:hypothetical protein